MSGWHIESGLEQAVAALATIGRIPSGGGYNRFAWTEDDRACREWFVAQAESRGLTMEVDRNYNLWAWLGEPGPGAVVTGSHLDSVPGGGAFDGPLGVISGLLALNELRRQGFTPIRPIAVGVFNDEEGARFGMSCVGSRLMTGTLDPSAALGLKDRSGITLSEAITAAGADPTSLGADPNRLAGMHAFVELHIEQGRYLARLDAPIGVATSIWPHGRWRLDIHGEANHAGTTLIDDRHDPVLALSEIVVAARESAVRHDGLATVGRIHVQPNATNAIAATAAVWLDARGPTEDSVRAIVADVPEAATVASAAHGVKAELSSESFTEAVSFAGELSDRLADLLDAPRLSTGAGHDAGILAPFLPATMIFVRNTTGVSHSPAEDISMADAAIGVEALARCIGDLAG